MAKKKTSVKSKQSKTADDRAFEHAKEVLLRNYKRILARKGVTHVDVNYRTRNGKRTKDIVIRVHVEKKHPSDEISERQMLRSIEDVKVDIVESLNTYEQTSAGNFPTLEGGVRIVPQHNPTDGGTLGIVCFTNENGTRSPRLLTNAHVVYGGSSKSGLPSRIPMLQAPSASGPNRRIGDAIKAKTFRNSLVDCALIEPDAGIDFNEGVPGILPNPDGIGELTRDDVDKKVRVKKLGEATGETEGIVDSVTLTFSVPQNTFLFQIGIKPVDASSSFSASGDSGSVVIRGNQVVGLLHGLSDSGKIAVACHMKDVAEKLGIKL